MTQDSSPRTIVHRYGWTGEEKAILAFFAAVPVVVAVWRLLLVDGGWVAPLVVAVLGWGVAAALVRLGNRRKDASRITATLTGTRLRVEGGRVRRSSGDLAHAVGARTTQLGPETVLVVALPEGSVMVPGRIAGDPALSSVLARHVVGADVPMDDGARQLLGA